MFWRIVTLLGGPVVRLAAVIEVTLALLLWGRWRRAAFLVTAVGGTGLLDTSLKKVVDRRRPDGLFGFTRDEGDSFPSGHTSGTVALAGSASYLLWRSTNSRLVGVLSGLAGFILSSLVIYSRVKLGRHHVGDTIAGSVLGLVWLAVSVALFRPTEKLGQVTPGEWRP